MSKKYLVAGFMLGFLAWIPFIAIVLSLSPFSLGFSNSAYTDFMGRKIPDFGWTLKKPIDISHYPEGSYTSLFAYGVFYVPYLFLLILVLWLLGKRKSAVPDGYPNGSVTE